MVKSSDRDWQAQQCPLCGGKPRRVAIQIEQQAVLQCATCTNGWTHPPAPSLPDYEHIHWSHEKEKGPKWHDRQTMEQLPNRWRRAIWMQIEELTGTLPQAGRWLDIGCGDSLVLEYLHQRGYVGVGIEASQKSVALARDAGLNVVHGFFPHPDLQGPFNAIHMSHILEHFRDPFAPLRAIVDLAPNGSLVLTQTNYLGVVPRTFGPMWYGWCLDGHYFHFTPRGLKCILEQHGFKVESLRQLSMTNESRRYKFVLGLFDRVKWWADQFILRARIPARWID